MGLSSHAFTNKIYLSIGTCLLRVPFAFIADMLVTPGLTLVVKITDKTHIIYQYPTVPLEQFLGHARHQICFGFMFDLYWNGNRADYNHSWVL